MKSFLFTIVMLFFISCSDEDEKEPTVVISPNAKVMLDVSYGDNPQQKYDIYLPEKRSSASTKTLIFVHGGSWVGGDKGDREVQELIKLVLNRKKDYAIINMNYTLADSETKAYPTQVNDIKAVIYQIKAKSKEYNIQPTFGFVGASSGAHIALLYSYAFDPANEVKMICNIVGPTDITDPAYLDNPFSINAFQILVENFDPKNTALLEEISPSFQVTADAPPTIMFYGNMDQFIPNTQHENLTKALDANNVINKKTIYDGGHGIWGEKSYFDLDKQLSDFLDTHL